MKFLKIMQENFTFKLIAIFLLSALSFGLCACSEKTPEQIAAENAKKTDIAVRRSKVFLFDEKPAQAIQMLEQVYQECGPSALLCEALADAYAQDGQLPSAAMFYDRAADLKNGDPELEINAAKCYEQSNLPDSAVKAYSKYLKSKPQDMVAWKAMAKCLEKQEKYQEALNAYLAALKAAGRNPTSAEAASIGILFTKIGNVPQARRWLEAAYKATIPENVDTRREILLSLLSVYLAEKETVLLNATVEELDKMEPNLVREKYPQLHAQLTEFFKNLKEAEEALKAEKAKKEAQEKEKAKKEAEEKAKKEAEEKAKKEAQEAKAISESAKKEENAGSQAAPEPGKPASPAQQTNSQPPQDPKSAITEIFSIAEEQMRDVEIKDESPEDTLKSAEGSFEKLLELSKRSLEKGDAKTAEQAAHRAIAANRNDSQGWRALAKAYELQNRDNDSYMAAREAYVRAPDDINATLFYLRNASRIQNNEIFLNSLYRAHEKFPNNVEILVGLARTYKLIGDNRNAKYFYNVFLNMAPKEHPLYKEMYYELEELLSK